MIEINTHFSTLCFVDRASRYNCVNKNQPDAQLILSIFHQSVHVLGVSRLIIRGTTICVQWNPTSTTDSHLKRIISTNCCIHTVVPPDDGPRYAQNM